MDVTCRPISGTQTQVLRQKILRPHQTLGQMVYPGHESDEGIHFGAFGGKSLVGIVSFFRELMPMDLL